MAEYIDREALISDMKKRYCTGCNSYNGVRCRACWVDDAMGEIDDAPAADVAPVVHGQWKHLHDGIYNCTNCGSITDGPVKIFDYCPYCGAKMDGGADDAVQG